MTDTEKTDFESSLQFPRGRGRLHYRTTWKHPGLTGSRSGGKSMAEGLYCGFCGKHLARQHGKT